MCSTETASAADGLIHDADQALYWAKNSGRNMTFLYTDEARATFANREAGDPMTVTPSVGAAAADQAERPADLRLADQGQAVGDAGGLQAHAYTRTLRPARAGRSPRNRVGLAVMCQEMQ